MVIPSLCAHAATSPCDVNGDGIVNITDVQLVIDQVLGNSACTVNFDLSGKCDASDVQIVVIAALGGPCNAATQGPTSVLQFGAKGDGVTDNYDALRAAAAYICTVPGGTLVFPPGTYLINQYRIIGGPNQTTVKNIRYTGCNGVTISGPGAIIDVKGDFRRAADVVSGSTAVSYENGVIPFEMYNSTGFRITGFELNGNVDKMTRDPNVVEGYNAGIATTNCRNYTIDHVNVHHFHTDGLSLGVNTLVADQNATLDSVTSVNNARQGLSLVQVRGSTITNSIFSNNGRTGGSYGYHMPAAGVDVEPVRGVPNVDVSTGLLNLSGCTFAQNIGLQLVSGWPDKVDSLTVTNSQIVATAPDSEASIFLNAAANSVTLNNTFTVAAGKYVLIAPTNAPAYPYLVNLTYQANIFNFASNQGIYPLQQAAPVVFSGNTVSVRSAGPDRTVLRFDWVSQVTGNKFFVSASGLTGSSQGDEVIVTQAGAPVFQNNQYTTDLTGTRYFVTYYGQGVSVSGEQFPDAANFKGVTAP